MPRKHLFLNIIIILNMSSLSKALNTFSEYPINRLNLSSNYHNIYIKKLFFISCFFVFLSSNNLDPANFQKHYIRNHSCAIGFVSKSEWEFPPAIVSSVLAWTWREVFCCWSQWYFLLLCPVLQTNKKCASVGQKEDYITKVYFQHFYKHICH